MRNRCIAQFTRTLALCIQIMPDARLLTSQH
jgi:hypothetical protein